MKSSYTEIWLEDGVERSEEHIAPAPVGHSVNCFLDDAEIVSPAQVGHPVNCFLDDAEIVPSDECYQFRLSSQQHLNLIYEVMRKKLSYHFMNPIQKWKAKRRYPWKLLLQVVKIIVVTWQMSLFGLRSHDYVQQHRDVTLALSHMFLLDWNPDQAVYPPSNGPYAVYTKPEFYDNVDNVVRQYSNFSNLAIASFSYDSPIGEMQPMQLCLLHYKQGDLFPFNSTVTIDNFTEETCLMIPVLFPSGDPEWDTFSIEDFLQSSNKTVKFSRLVEAKMIFSIKAILPKSLSKLDVPECYRLKIQILYDNQNHDGQMGISLSISGEKLDCQFHMVKVDTTENRNYVCRQILNSIVIILCIASIILCGRSLISAQVLRKESTEFFDLYFNIKVTLSEKIDFIDFWYVLIIFSDIFIMSGSIIKIQIEEQHHTGTLYTHCSVLLGLGNLFVWVGLLRYLGFFKKYNMLILTLKCAMPNVFRFLLCAVLLYAGFCFCGWIVLGPYHVKFQSLSRTSECLFAVMNGDDMFSTFVLLDTDDILIWYFSRVYLYLFLVLFVYVVISLFISVIMDTFETIKQFYAHGTPPETTVELFLSAALHRPSTPPISRHSTPLPTRPPSPLVHDVEEKSHSKPYRIPAIVKLKVVIADLLLRIKST